MAKNHTSSQNNSREFAGLSTKEKILKYSEELSPPKGMPLDDALDAVLQKIGNPVKSRPIVTLIPLLKYAAAVVFVLLSTWIATTVFSTEKVTTPYGGQTTLSLPDGSDVLLNAGSKLAWSKRKFTDNRKLKLEGEAFFSVVKGNEFVIKTKNGDVKVLGTELNVYSRGKEFRVSCLSGKVAVTANSQRQVITPGESVDLQNGRLSKTDKRSVEKEIAWKQGIFYFEDKPVVSIFEELERQFDVSIKYEGIQGRYITVSFTNKNLQEALDVICIPMGLKYEVNNNTVRIFEEPG